MKVSRKFFFIFIFLFLFLIFTSLFVHIFLNAPPQLNESRKTTIKFPSPSLHSSESVMNGTYYFWNGYLQILFTIYPMSGSENYTLVSPTRYSVSEDFNGTLYTRDINDQTRVISNSTNTLWGNNTHEFFWIFTNVNLGDIVPVSLSATDLNLNVTAQETINHLGKDYNCWKLTDANTLAYYDRATGFLIKFTYTLGIVTYTFNLVATNAQKLPQIEILSPSEPIYYFPNIPIIVKNYTNIQNVWARNSSNGGSSWSQNYTLSFNNTHYVNSNINWSDGNYILQVFANNSYGLTTIRTQNFEVDTTGPYIQITSPLNTTYFYRTFDIIIENYTFVDSLWYRYNNRTGWTANSTITYLGSLYSEDTIIWNDTSYHLQVFANDTSGEIAQRDQWFSVAATLPFNLSSNFLTDASPQIALDYNDTIHIAWIKNSGSTYEIVYDNNLNGHFGNSRPLYSSFNALTDLNMVIYPSSNIVHLCWMEFGVPTDIYYTNNTGGTFSTPIKVPQISLSFFLEISLGVDSTDTAHLALTAGSWIGLTLTLYYTNNGGGSFSAPSSIYSNPPNLITSPAIALDSSSVAHVFWNDNSTGNQDIFYDNNSGGSFSGIPTQITTNLAIDTLADIVIDSSDVVHVTWNAQCGDYYDVMYINNSLGSFSNPINVSKNPNQHDLYPRITVDSGTSPDSVYIAWLGVAQGRLQPFITDNRKGVFCTPRKSYDISNGSSSVDLAVHPYEGLTYLVWSGNDTNDDEIYFTEDYQPLSLISPKNTTYSNNYIPLEILNSSHHLTRVWCRNRTGAGTWSPDYNLTWDGVHFSNSSLIYWPSGPITLQIFSNDSNGRNFSMYEYFFIDPTPPTGYQWLNNTSVRIQKGAPIWINGTAWDPALGTGIRNITIEESNTSNGKFDWSLNIGDNYNFAFYNVSSLADNLLNGFYEINITITDNANNYFKLICNVTVETCPPYGSQDSATQQPTNGPDIWVNGTANDDGFGIASVIIQYTNHSGNPWGSNLGTNNTWAFNNVTTVNHGIWGIQINVTDLANNSAIILCYVNVDLMPPSGSQSASTNTNSPQNGDSNGYIWVNGTATDGFGVGILNISVVGTNHTPSNVWSINRGTNETWAFNNISVIFDGIWEVTINLIDKLGNNQNISCFIRVDSTAPSGTQNLATTLPQKPDSNGYIWVNGTATDGFGVGLLNVFVAGTNHTPSNVWSINRGTNETWAFNNISVILDGMWDVTVTLIDQLGNSRNISCYIHVDTIAPTGLQNFTTTIPQNGGVQQWVWINGTAFDGGSGVKNISITYTNSSATFTNNLGDTENWAFHNSSTIFDGVWIFNITISDKAGHHTNITGIIIVDTIAPSQPIVSDPVILGLNVTLNWDPVLDNTTVIYFIFRNNTNIANTTLTSYLDANLSLGIHIYKIIPVDAAGNVGPASENKTVTLTETNPTSPPPNFTLIIILIIIGIALSAIAVIGVRKRRKTRLIPPRAELITKPKTPAPSPEIEIVEEEKPPESAEKAKTPSEPKPPTPGEKAETSIKPTPSAPSTKVEVEKPSTIERPPSTMETLIKELKPKPPAPSIEATISSAALLKEEKEEKIEPKVVQFTFFCTSCKKWHKTDEFGEINCPSCNNPLKLSYYCSTCEKRFMVKEPGLHYCPNCKGKLIP